MATDNVLVGWAGLAAHIDYYHDHSEPVETLRLLGDFKLPMGDFKLHCATGLSDCKTEPRKQLHNVHMTMHMTIKIINASSNPWSPRGVGSDFVLNSLVD